MFIVKRVICNLYKHLVSTEGENWEYIDYTRGLLNFFFKGLKAKQKWGCGETNPLQK